jgi:hypothetical protein
MRLENFEVLLMLQSDIWPIYLYSRDDPRGVVYLIFDWFEEYM